MFGTGRILSNTELDEEALSVEFLRFFLNQQKFNAARS